MAIKRAYVWRKSVYDNNYRCAKCGNLLFDGKKPVNVTWRYINDKKCIFCNKCNDVVAYSMMIVAPEAMSGKQGYFGDYLKKMRS